MFPEAILFVAQTNPQVCYMHSEGILSGELKHGPLALVDENMPCIILMTKDRTYTKSHNALQQVSARHVSTIGPHLILRRCSLLALNYFNTDTHIMYFRLSHPRGKAEGTNY